MKMLRFCVLTVVLSCALGAPASNSPFSAGVSGETFLDAIKKHDHLYNAAVKVCDEPKEDDIKYVLFTREKPDGEPIIRNAQNITDSSLNVKKKLKVIVHAWLQNPSWVGPVVKDYLYCQNVDVLVVDWREYAENCNIQTTNEYVLPFVGETLSYLLREMLGLGQSGNRVHLIGFSHGAHIAGIAARYMAPHMAARISALDPIRLTTIDQPGGGKLLGGDAKFIDVIVTSLPGLSFEYEIGNVTFYPNGGMIQYQGRCTSLTDPMAQMICSHALAYKLFHESLVSKDKFPGYRCASYEEFLSGRCKNPAVAHMGEYVDQSARGRYYLEINNAAPFDKGYNLPQSSY